MERIEGRAKLDKVDLTRRASLMPSRSWADIAETQTNNLMNDDGHKRFSSKYTCIVEEECLFDEQWISARTRSYREGEKGKRIMRKMSENNNKGRNQTKE